MLRFAVRHVYMTIYEHTVLKMQDLGWTDVGGVFGSKPVTYQQYPIMGSRDESKLEPNVVAISIGVEDPPRDLELGGYMRSQNVSLFAEVYGENTAIALSIASDLRDIWEGRYGKLFLPIMDYTAQPPAVVPGWELELGATSRGEVEARFYYQIVRSAAELIYNDEQY